jgi:hypothetical protein
MKGPLKALAFVAAVAGTAFVLSTSAFALGGGSGPTAPGWKLRLGPATWSGRVTGLYPGVSNDSEIFPFTLTNSSRSTQRLRSVTVSIATRPGGDTEGVGGVDIRGCRARWFAVSVDPRDRPLPAKLAAGASYAGKVELTMRNSSSNENACASASPAFTLTVR